MMSVAFTVGQRLPGVFIGLSFEYRLRVDRSIRPILTTQNVVNSYVLRSICASGFSLIYLGQFIHEEVSMTSLKTVATLANQTTSINMNARQAPLTESYKAQAELAQITDFAKTTSESLAPTLPLHSEVLLTQHDPYSIPVGVHTAVGGDSDFPSPGDILCGALAACLDSVLRIIANKVGIPLQSLSVSVSAQVDVRGTLRVEKSIPVGFQSMDIEVNIEAADSVSDKMIERLVSAAEYSCIILQTLRNGPEIKLQHTRC